MERGEKGVTDGRLLCLIIKPYKSLLYINHERTAGRPAGRPDRQDHSYICQVADKNIYEQAGQRTRNLPLGPRSQMGYKSWAPGYRGRLTVFTFIFDLWILVMFDPMKILTESKIPASYIFFN